jgi:hypothetical protein
MFKNNKQPIINSECNLFVDEIQKEFLDDLTKKNILIKRI